ncbi:MAG: hypothetical protein ACKOXZ_07375, partial [Polynucleobacter victoriensis]
NLELCHLYAQDSNENQNKDSKGDKKQEEQKRSTYVDLFLLPKKSFNENHELTLRPLSGYIYQ